jgi:hypothetical protein
MEKTGKERKVYFLSIFFYPTVAEIKRQEKKKREGGTEEERNDFICSLFLFLS